LELRPGGPGFEEQAEKRIVGAVQIMGSVGTRCKLAAAGTPDGATKASASSATAAMLTRSSKIRHRASAAS